MEQDLELKKKALEDAIDAILELEKYYSLESYRNILRNLNAELHNINELIEEQSN